MALTGAPERLIPGAIPNVHRATEASLNSLDQRIEVRTAFENGATTFSLHAKEDVDVTLTVPMSAANVLHDALTHMNQHGGEVTVPADGAGVYGSKLFEALINPQLTAGATLTVGSVPRPAVQYTRLVDRVSGVESPCPDVHGNVVFGTESLTFTGTACGGIVSFSYRRPLKNTSSFGEMNLAMAFDAWEGIDVRRLPHFDVLHRMFGRLSAGCDVRTSLDIDGQTLMSGSGSFSAASSMLTAVYDILEYVRQLRVLTKYLDIPVLFRTENPIRQTDMRAVERAVQTLEHRRELRVDDLRSPPTCSFAIGDLDVLRGVATSDQPLVIRWLEANGEVLEAFGQPVRLPRCEIMLSGVRPDFGKVDISESRPGDSVNVTWRPLPDFRCAYRFLSGQELAERQLAPD
jgi:hypothetical protein